MEPRLLSKRIFDWSFTEFLLYWIYVEFYARCSSVFPGYTDIPPNLVFSWSLLSLCRNSSGYVHQIARKCDQWFILKWLFDILGLQWFEMIGGKPAFPKWQRPKTKLYHWSLLALYCLVARFAFSCVFSLPGMRKSSRCCQVLGNPQKF